MRSESRIEVVVALLNRWDNRRRRIEGLQWGTRGLLIGLLAGVVSATIVRFEPLMNNRELAITALSLATICVVAGLIIALLLPRTLIEKARFADRQLNLLERTSTAVEIHEGLLTIDYEMAENQLADTFSAAGAVDAASMLPWKFQRRDGYLILIAISLLSAAVILDNPAAAELERRRAIDKIVEGQIASLESLEEAISNNPELGVEALEELSTPIQSALQELSEGDISREELFATLSEAEADFRELSNRYDNSDLLEGVQEAAKPLSESARSQDFGEALKSGDLAGAGVELNKLADGIPALDSDELAALARSLAQAAEALGTVDPELAGQLSDGAAAITRGDIASAQRALREAAATLQRRTQGQAIAGQASAAADQLQQGREVVADAGQGNQPGDPGQGSGSSGQNGEGSGEGNGSGSGAASDGGGSGNSNLTSGDESAGGSTSVEQGGGSSGPGPGGGHSENVYAPDFVDLSSEPGIGVELPAECTANPADCGILISERPTVLGDEESLVPYEQVLGEYRRAAYLALEEEYVPLGLREYIKDYFTSLEP
jgi:hypothetical protein